MPNSIYSVTQVNTYIKNMFQTDYLLRNLDVRGEISNLKYHSSGHIYFTLKDEKSAIKCVMFAGDAKSLDFKLKEGMQVSVNGRIDIFERDGTYQLYVKTAKEEGRGDLFLEFEKLKEKLGDMGMFDESYKRPIPAYVKTLGVVTAPTGAAVRDIINVSKRRNPGIGIVLFPAIVQGEDAPASIVKGIKTLENYGVDLIIVGRGGGSVEDLWCFNSEDVAQAIFDCSVPIISAVGHETDFTIADFVADKRAATPSQAAEFAVCDISVILTRLGELKRSLIKDMNRILFEKKKDAEFFARQLSALSPVNRLNEQKQRLCNCKNLLNRAMSDSLKNVRHRLEAGAGRLHGLSPLKRLSGGYAYVESDGKAVKSIKEVKEGTLLSINVTDGRISARVEDSTPYKQQ